MEVCLLWVLGVVMKRFLCWDDHSSRGVLVSVVCLCVILNPRQWEGFGQWGAVVLLRKYIIKIETNSLA